MTNDAILQGLVKVAGDMAVKVPDKSIMALPTVGPTNLSDKEAVIEPLEQLPRCITVATTLSSPVNSQINLQVMNLSDEDVRLKPETPPGNLQCVTSVESSQVFYERSHNVFGNVSTTLEKKPQFSQLIGSWLNADQRQGRGSACFKL